MNGPLLPLSDDELVLVSSATSGTNLRELIETVRDWITQGHREAQNDRAYGTITVR